MIGSDSSTSDGRARQIGRGLAACTGVGAGALIVAVLAVAALATGSVVAGDNVALVRPDPADLEAAPGDEITVDVVMTSHGGYDDVGVVSVDLVALYHPDYLEVVEIEAGPWLEQGNETEVRRSTTVANDEGATILEQYRDPVAGGATGEAVLATMTLRVADDADPAAATVSFGATEVELESRYLQPVHDRNVTVTINGGEERPPAYDRADLETIAESGNDSSGGEGADDSGNGSERSDGEADAGSDSGSTDDAATENGTATDDGTSGASGDDGDGRAGDDSADDDRMPGLTAVTTALALGLVLVALGIRLRRR